MKSSIWRSPEATLLSKEVRCKKEDAMEEEPLFYWFIITKKKLQQVNYYSWIEGMWLTTK